VPAPDSAAQRGGRQFAEFGLWLVLGSGLTWRLRSAYDLQDNPLDWAGMARLALDGLAVAAAVLSLCAPQPQRRAPPAYRFFLGYVAVAALGVLPSVQPRLVAFRVAELVAYCIVAWSCYQVLPAERVFAVVRRFCWLLVATVAVGVLLWPGEALTASRGGIVPFRLRGVVPDLSANTVGAVGLVLFAVGLGDRRLRRLPVAAGLALVVLAQYRTGYIAVPVIGGLWLLCRRSLAGWAALLVAVPTVYLLAISATARNAWIRGEDASQSNINLSGRTLWWADAIDVAGRSPWIGTGLSTGTRYEVLADRLGRDEVSTIHGTWIEAYAGTGLIGLAALATSVALAWVAAWRVSRLSALPLLLLTALTVRSLTGSAFELPSFALMLFLLVVTVSATLPGAAVEAAERAEAVEADVVEAAGGASRTRRRSRRRGTSGRRAARRRTGSAGRATRSTPPARR